MGKPFLAAALVCWCVTAVAQEPVVTLPEKVSGEAGAFIRVEAQTNGQVVRWYEDEPGLNLFPVDLLKDTRTAVVTATREGRYRLLAYTAIGDVPSAPAVVTITVGNVPPVPPGPTPPGPVPPGPDLTGIAKVVYDAAKGIDKATLTQAAGAYGSQVSAIGAGAYNAVSLDAAKQQIVDAITSANPPREKAPALFEAIDGQLQALEEANKLGTLAAVSAVLSDIVTGLEAAAK